MNHGTVFLFGAGVSADAGIPLLGNFVDKMWEFAMRGQTDRRLLSDSERALLEEANRIRIELQAYQSRANFNDRNIEDLLSILAFESMASDAKRRQYECLVAAISLTIELSCRVPFTEESTLCSETPAPVPFYARFWDILFRNHSANLPTIITFNYDLVLERALYHHFHQINNENVSQLPMSVKCRYSADREWIVTRENCHYGHHRGQGVRAKLLGPGTAYVTFDYLKLHGSLNWSSVARVEDGVSPTRAVANPVILPPVFNKLQDGNSSIQSVWTTAIKKIQTAKNLVIVGYSLPPTDIYLQYFLKTAVGPNSNLNKIYVFNPALFQENPDATQMQERYASCFSIYLRERIDFKPPSREVALDQAGKFSHFLQVLQKPEAGPVF